MLNKSFIVISIIVALVVLMGCGGEHAPTITLEEKLIQKLLDDEAADTTEYPDTIENAILTAYLSRPDFEGYYIIVDPNTTIELYADYTECLEWMRERKDGFIKWFKDRGHDISSLYDRFLEVNSSPGTLAVQSSMTEGYYINYDGKYMEYLDEISSDFYEEDSGWWQFVYENFPHFQSSLSLSLPAYEPETKYVLIYIFVGGYTSAYHGDGWPSLKLMKYENGILTDVCSKDLGSAQMFRVDSNISDSDE